MKVKNEKTKLIIWAIVALVIGVVIGMIITNATTGNANRINNNKLFTVQNFDSSGKEISKSLSTEIKSIIICECSDESSSINFTYTDDMYGYCSMMCPESDVTSIWYN